MAQRESRLSSNIQTALRARGIFVFKVHGSSHMMAGLPDLICCVEGKFLGLEVKHPETRENTSPRQKLVHEMIARAGGKAVVVTSVHEALVAAEQLTEMLDPSD